MKQQRDPRLIFNDRPNRDDIIDRDEIMSLIIDLETMSPELFFNSYFLPDIDQQR